MTETGAQQVPSPATPGTITLIEGTAFCVCLSSGDIVPGGTDGVFYRDTRLVSRWELLVDGDPVEPMAVLPGQPFFATFVGRSHPRPGRAESTVLVTRTRYVGDGMLAGKLHEPPELAYFRAEIEPRLGEDARFVGEADMRTKQELAGRAQCLVFPICWDEPFGMVMIEAMACGTPVVALNRGSVPEVVADGVTGFVLDDPADLPAAIRKAADLDPAACRRHVERNFDVSVMAEGYERLYAHASARRASS